jgi:outer membrane biosynthesis protein TonB
MAASVGLHLFLLILAWATTRSTHDIPDFVAFQIELVSPAPPAQAEEETPATQRIVVERPDPKPAQPEEQADPVPIEKPEEKKPDPPKPDETPTEELSEPEEEVTVATTTEAAPEKPKEAGEGVNVRLEGLRRDYPVYYNNVIRQIFRCFRWRQGGSWETTISFVIERDGTATGLSFVSRSGNSAFDFQAMGAVDCAGKGRFGPLPDDLPWDRLPIQFKFSPGGGIGLIPEIPQVAEVASQ